MIDKHYGNRKLREHKNMRMAYSKLIQKEEKYKFMVAAEAWAIFLTNPGDADDQGSWHPMLGGYIVQDGDQKFPRKTWQAALKVAEQAREEYRNKLNLIEA